MQAEALPNCGSALLIYVKIYFKKYVLQMKFAIIGKSLDFFGVHQNERGTKSYG